MDWDCVGLALVIVQVGLSLVACCAGSHRILDRTVACAGLYLRACVRAQVRVQQKHIPGSPFKLSVAAGAFSLCQCVQHCTRSVRCHLRGVGRCMCASTCRLRPFPAPIA